jgi:effector-binding domain-containing protein
MIFHDAEYREHDVDIEVCIPVKAHNPELATHRCDGAAKAGCVTYRGAYEQTPRLYESMLRWVEQSGLRIAGPLREVYHRFGADQAGYSLPAHVLASSSAELVTELQTPVVANE